MDGGTRVAEVLKAHGVEFVFTLVGGHVSPILVASKKAGIRVIDVRHEVNTVFAADAVSRLSGVPGVAVVTAGPGVTNTITAIKNAQLAQSPLVLIGGATATLLRGRGSLQDIDQIALVAPHVKWHARPNTLREVIPAMQEAFRQAQEGVPGPVFVEIAVDLLYPEAMVREWYKKETDKPNKTPAEHALALYVRGHLKWVFAGAEPVIDPPAPQLPQAAGRADVKKAAAWIGSAERPVLVLGSQAMLRPRRVRELVDAVERLGIPVFLSGMGRGLLGQGHPLQLRHKRSAALKESDLVILAGVPVDFRLNYGSPLRRTKVIGINLSKQDLTKNRKPELGIQADPHTVICQLARAVSPDAPDRAPWLASLHERNSSRDAEIRKMADEDVGGINPLRLCMALEDKLSDDSILVGDGGDFVATASYIVSPRGPLTWLDPGVFGTLGVGAGFALGAKLVRPDADVWLLWGDGAAGFSIMEYDTFARHGVAVNALIGNDGGWTQIERDQVPTLGDDVACRLTQMDYDVVAEGCGAHGIRVTDEASVPAALDEAHRVSREEGRPTLVNALIGKTDFRKGSISM
ncbi:MAG: acetolactate synthase-like protein [Myxococcota bacterium]|jgi:acetolactate synthase-like protein